MRSCFVLLLFTLACTPDLDGPEIVRDLRILAVQAEPPEASIDLQTGAIEPVTVRILVVDPVEKERGMSMNGALCFPTDSGRCDEVPSVAIGPPDSPGPSSAIQAGATPSWTVQVPPAIVQAAVQQDDLKGFGGVRVQFSLQVDNGDPHGPVFAEKILLFSPPGETVNHNPRIESLELTRDGVPAGTLQAGDPLSVRVGVETGILPHLATAEGGAETYTAIDLRGKAVTLTEAPRYSFFTTSSGDLDVATADEPLPGTTPLEGLVRFTALRRGAGTLWIVVRDGRGGLGWLEIPYQAS
ncbi:MAG: hypothetical protein ACJ78Y_18185 [Myxococcales bacterium]